MLYRQRGLNNSSARFLVDKLTFKYQARRLNRPHAFHRITESAMPEKIIRVLEKLPVRRIGIEPFRENCIRYFVGMSEDRIFKHVPSDCAALVIQVHAGYRLSLVSASSVDGDVTHWWLMSAGKPVDSYLLSGL